MTACLLALACAAIAREPSAPEMRRVLERYRTLLLAEQSSPLRAAVQLGDRIAPDGTWADIDYGDASRSNWQVAIHLRRLRLLARAASEQSITPADTAKLQRAIELGLDHWCTKRYHAQNWWFNEIGVPRAMRDIVVLLGARLTGAQRDAATKIIAQHNMRGAGANLMWSAELSLHHGCLTENRKQIDRAAQRLWKEIEAGADQGIQRDGSFHQHDARLQTFHYGKAYLDVVCQIAWQLTETPWSIPGEKREIISRYILGGPQWMCRGRHTVPGTLDRAVSRKGSLGGADLRPLLRLWREVDPKRREALDAFIARQTAQGVPLTGYRHYPQADFTVYHRPAASVFLKTVSARTRFTESINSENRKGVPFLNCGDHYVLRDGLEYDGLQPVWQWEHLPGLTVAAGDAEQKRTRFVGGIGNGQSGLTAMDYVRGRAADAPAAIRKSWFFHGDVTVCLMAASDRERRRHPLVSALEQCRLRAPATARIDRSGVQDIGPGRHAFDSAEWLLHNGIGYIPLNMAGVRLFTGERTGSWHSINAQYSRDPVREPVFQVLLDHGKRLGGQGWAILLDATREKLDALRAEPAWEILRNDRDCQAVRFRDGLCMASFFAAGSVSGARNVEVNEPCLAMWTEDKLWMCDPTMKGRDVSVRWHRREGVVRLPPGGQVRDIVPADIRTAPPDATATTAVSALTGMHGASLATHPDFPALSFPKELHQ